MSIATELTKTAEYIGNAYDSINTMGGTIPQDKNLANMSTAIESIPSGGGGDALKTYCAGKSSFTYLYAYNSTATSIPENALLDFSNGTIFSSMFSDCSALSVIPQINTASGTNFSGMFRNCSSIVTIPLLSTSNGTNFSQMFYACSSLVEIPQLNTSKLTSAASMFRNCSSLTTVPILDFSATTAAASFASMFEGCNSLSSESLNNILASLATSKVSTNKQLSYIGLTRDQAITCTGLSNWAALSAKGWTTGY